MSSGYGYLPDPSIDFRTRPWYKDTLDNDGLFYSSPYKDSNLDRYVVTISTTCYKSDGTLAGVLALDIFVDTLFAIADDKEIDGDSYVFLIDNNMGIATHPNKAYEYVQEQPVKISETVEKNLYENFRHLSGEEQGNLESFHYDIKDYDGIHRAVYVSRINCCGWYVVAAIDRRVYLYPLLKIVLMLTGALALCLLAGAIARVSSVQIIRQLNEANESAMLANETKGEFLANMSHEIRTPINAIIGMNEMILRENNDPTINDYALDISSAGRSLITIVNDILDFSKIESGKMEIVETELNIASVVNDIVNMSESRLGDKKLALFFRVDPSIPAGLIGDEMRIKQVILNMMTNAIKYTQSGYVLMRVEYTKQDYGINLDVFVKDTGIGISEDNLDNLYQSFQRFDAKRNRSIEGTGLGLAITKQLVQAMGGYINVTSKLGAGSEFSVSIPLGVSNAEPVISVNNIAAIRFVTCFPDQGVPADYLREMDAIIEEIREGLGLSITNFRNFDELKTYLEQEETTHVLVDEGIYQEQQAYFTELAGRQTVFVLYKRGKLIDVPDKIIPFYTPFYDISLTSVLNNRKQNGAIRPYKKFDFVAPEAKVLIVDDNSVNLKVAAGLMKPYGMRITTLDSGRKAIQLLQEHPDFDIVFMDHMMPEMDGIETTARIRKLEGAYYTSLPIVALTANTINNAKSMFLSSGFNDFLAKPIDLHSLDRILREYTPENKIVVREEKQEKAVTDSGKENPVCEPETVRTVSDFDPDMGVKYVAGDQALYLEILTDYYNNAADMKQILNTSFADQDWKLYAIKVHSLKSTSLSVGAQPLSELSKELEFAGKAGNSEPILQKHQSLMELYERTLQLVEQYLVENGVAVASSEEKAEESVEEIDHEVVKEYADHILEALQGFDSDRAEELIREISEKGEAYKRVFAKVRKAVNDFEYQKAEEEIEGVRNL